MSGKCLSHLDFANETCPDCGLPVDAHGNTEAQFEFCCFPDCGCDGARNCSAPTEPNYLAVTLNREKRRGQ